MRARSIAKKCKLRVCCLVKNAPLPRGVLSYPLRKGQKNISENMKTFLQDACDYSSWFSFFEESCSSEGLKPDHEVRRRKYCPLLRSMGRMSDFFILAPWDKARQTQFRSLDHQQCRLKAKLFLPSQPPFPQHKWFLPWKKGRRQRWLHSLSLPVLVLCFSHLKVFPPKIQ